ncbi:tyrosine/serine/threonine protein phosphatase pps1 [Mortierella sp. NVP85]|nr:tyrosine/serine/threonine protein phosphatase pps1 [Mortierella sp. NVP85]
MRRAAATALVKNQSPVVQNHMTNLINMAFFIHAVTNPGPSAFISSSSGGNQSHPQPHQVLIHCVDGYTESAPLALSVLMIHFQISLAEAYLKLQTEHGRSFFVYPNDAIMMLEVENQIWKRLLLEKVERESVAKWGMSGPLSPPMSALPKSDPSSPSSSSFFSSLLNMTNQMPKEEKQGEQEQEGQGQREQLDGSQSPRSSGPLPVLMEGIEPMPDRDEELAIQRPFAKPAHMDRFEWFYHPEFEGSFPSRILPFLYLGNLAHASNPGLLKSLGIHYVLSVGEEARGLNESSKDMCGNVSISAADTALSKANTGTRFTVKLVDDMFDNGVDSLWNHLENCVAFVDEARKANARVLIHCRVGVSRSATIVIAYLMAHYNLSLVEAYLMVRARRLSVIIQPNLLFMYELLQWEQQLRGRFDPMGWPGVAREVHGLNITVNADMAEEAVSRYLDAASASSKGDAGVIDFFISEKVAYQDRGSFSAAWLRGVERLKNVNLKRRLKADWEASKKTRKEFWDQLYELERDELAIENINIGASYKRLQEEAAPVISDVTKLLTLDLLPCFLAANYIWDVRYQLPGMSDENHAVVQAAMCVPVIHLSDQLVLFCRSLLNDLKSKGHISSRATKSREEDKLLVLLQEASQKLPIRFLPFKHLRNEDTHAHSVLDSLLTFVFPAYHKRYELHWANRGSDGSRARRGDPLKPDATVVKEGFELGFVEVKPPKEERHQRAYLEDIWALSGFAKDCIDLHLRHSRILTTVPCLLVFGFQMTLYQLTFQAGIYVWQDVYTSYLPKDRYDSGNMIECVDLVRTFKAIMDEADTGRYVRTPTNRVKDDDELPDLFRPRLTNISPSKRPFFGHT